MKDRLFDNARSDQAAEATRFANTIATAVHPERSAAADPRFVQDRPGRQALLRNSAMQMVGITGSLLRLAGGPLIHGQLGILTYHRVYPDINGLPPLLHNVAPQRMREQLLGLKRRGFRFISLKDAIDASQKGVFPERALVVTFDDGFENVLTRALPILREAQVPATVFVNTAYLGKQSPFPFDSWGCRFHDRAPPESWRPLTQVQCRELQASGLVTVGAHTHTHEDFRGRAEEFLRDAQQSIDLVRDWFREDPVLFAFPYGSPQDGFAGGELRTAIMKTDAACALTTDTLHVAPGSDPFHWGRFNVFGWDTSATLAGKLDGYYSWAPQLWRRAVGRREKTAIREPLSSDAVSSPVSKVGCNQTEGKLPIRIAFLTNFVPPHVAPVLREVAARVESLTVLISTAMEGDRTWEPDWNGIDVKVQRSWTFSNPKRHALGFRLSNYIHFPSDTLDQLAQARPDVIVTCEMGWRSILSTIYARMFRRTPLVIGCGLSEHTERGVGWLKHWLRRRLTKQADALLTSGSSGQRYFRSLGAPSDWVTVFPYTAVPLFHTSHEPPPATAAISRILCVGQLVKRKGVVPFALGLAEWARQWPAHSLELLLAGDGPEQQKLVAHRWPNNLQIRFLGHLSGEGLRSAYQQVDLFAFPTLADEWGLVTDEAMWSGLPVLGSIYAQSVSDLVQEGVNGWQYDPLRDGDLQRVLTLALHSTPEQLTRMRTAAWNTARERTPAFAANCLIKAVESAMERFQIRSAQR